MRIGLIAPPWMAVPPRGHGDTELMLHALATGLTAAGHQVLLATTGDSDAAVEQTWVHPRARTADIGETPVELRHVLHAYEAVDGADIIHDHTLTGPAYASLRPRPGLVATNHKLFGEDVKAILTAVAHRVAIVALSRHHAATAGDVPVTRVIHPGIDTDMYPVGPGGDQLVFAGRMAPASGARGAIDIARMAGAPLTIIAGIRRTSEQQYFDTVIRPLLDDDIRYVGDVDPATRLELLGRARALINPLRRDVPFGMGMVEALACGTPVIATPRGAVSEIVDHGRTGFVSNSLRSMAAAVEAVGSLDRSTCRAAATARFSARRLADEHLALYAATLGIQDRDEPASKPASEAGTERADAVGTAGSAPPEEVARRRGRSGNGGAARRTGSSRRSASARKPTQFTPLRLMSRRPTPRGRR